MKLIFPFPIRPLDSALVPAALRDSKICLPAASLRRISCGPKADRSSVVEVVWTIRAPRSNRGGKLTEGWTDLALKGGNLH